MMYVVELNGKKYGIELFDTIANIKECVDIAGYESECNDDEFMDIPDLFPDDLEEERINKNCVTATMPGTIISVNVEEGAMILKGDSLIVYESMKMENDITSEWSGRVEKIHVQKGDKVERGKTLLIIAND